MTKQDREVEKLLARGMVQVRDVELVKKYIKPASVLSPERYDRLCELIAETGALVIPFRDLSQVREILREEA